MTTACRPSFCLKGRRFLRYILLSLTATCTFWVVYYLLSSPMITSPDIQIVFPITRLQKDATLLKPTNLSTAYEYYLLENLGIGLLRDDMTRSNGYHPLLAKRWYQTDPKIWRFELNPAIKWSDGTPITPDQLIDHFKTLSHTPSRHIVYLRHLTAVTYLPESHSLDFHFDHPTNSGLLHELSLADAVLAHPDHPDWKVTSGPYAVKSYSFANRELLLEANAYCPLYQSEMPQHPRLFTIKDRNDIYGLFDTLPTDLMYLPSQFMKDHMNFLWENAPVVVTGYPTSIYYFKFNPDHPITHDPAIRKGFATLAHLLFQETPPNNDNVQIESQMVPLGYSGRIKKLDAPLLRESITPLHGRSLKLALPDHLLGIDSYFKTVFARATQYGVQIDVDYLQYGAALPKETFAKMDNFVGNQKDALGSWNFLFSDDALQIYRPERLFTEVMSTSTPAKREELLQDLHRYVLKEAILVPLFVQSRQVAIAKRIDIERWNRFDMRLRIYDIRFK